MYTPPAFRINDSSLMLDSIERWNFGLVISNVAGDLETSLLPFIVDRENQRLIGHFARANPHWRCIETAKSMLVSFQGPHCYISPNWYREKNLVPTWNYLAIQVRGKPTLIQDPAQCRSVMDRLVQHQESRLDPPQNRQIWSTAQMDPQPLAAMMKSIVCFDIRIETMKGKAKLSQNKSVQDQQGVIETLEHSNDSDEAMIAHLMKQSLSNNKKPDNS